MTNQGNPLPLCEEAGRQPAHDQHDHRQRHITEDFTSDEKSQIQALDRTAPILPIRPGLPEKATHDYKRNGTTTLFAALEVATGKVTDQCYDRHGKAEFLDFLKKVARAYPDQRAARRRGQLPHPQARRHQRVAGQEPTDHAALHPDLAAPG